MEGIKGIVYSIEIAAIKEEVDKIKKEIAKLRKAVVKKK